MGITRVTGGGILFLSLESRININYFSGRISIVPTKKNYFFFKGGRIINYYFLFSFFFCEITCDDYFSNKDFLFWNKHFFFFGGKVCYFFSRKCYFFSRNGENNVTFFGRMLLFF